MLQAEILRRRGFLELMWIEGEYLLTYLIPFWLELQE